MIHLVTFSDESMSRAADLCEVSARRHGVSRAWHWSKKQLWASPFYRAHKDILDNPRGVGYWLWKPYLLSIAVDSAIDGDIVIYSDAGIEFVDNVNYIIDRMDQDIFLFGNQWEHAHWCKADIVHEVMPEWAEFRQPFKQTDGSVIKSISMWEPFGKQAQASVIFFRVSEYSRKFVAEWLKWCLRKVRYSTICTDEWRYLIDDSPSIAPNHPEFRENRHDQAILTTMAYREGIKLHWWPAMYNDGAFTYERGEYPDEGYPVLFHHHRRRNHEWEQVA